MVTSIPFYITNLIILLIIIMHGSESNSTGGEGGGQVNKVYKKNILRMLYLCMLYVNVHVQKESIGTKLSFFYDCHA